MVLCKNSHFRRKFKCTLVHICQKRPLNSGRLSIKLHFLTPKKCTLVHICQKRAAQFRPIVHQAALSYSEKVHASSHLSDNGRSIQADCPSSCTFLFRKSARWFTF